MSALGQGATFCTAQICRLLLDHVVGSGKQCLRNAEAKGFGGLEIDDKLELGRLLDRDVTRLGIPENLVDQFSGACEQVRDVRSRTSSLPLRRIRAPHKSLVVVLV
jgi:hypothetical protein